MAMFSPLRGRELPGHKYIRRIMGDNGKWRYIYDKSDTENKKPGVYTGKTASWVKSYYATRNKRISSLPVSQIDSGRNAASKKVSTSGRRTSSSSQTPQWDTSMTYARINNETTKEEYKEMADKLEKESKEKIEKNEQYYKNLYEQEKESVKNKILKQLNAQYPDGIPESEMKKVDFRVESETKTLWNEVYKPMVDRVNDVIKANSEAVLRVLRKKYNQD